LKKEAKNFFKLGRAYVGATGQKSKKFLRRFFQKAATFLTLPGGTVLFRRRHVQASA
jgi:hypothetical protein